MQLAINPRVSLNGWMIHDQTDEQLMLAYAQGNKAAFEQLYFRHKGPLFRFFLHQLYQKAIAEELYQETWMALIKNSNKYQQQAKFTTYLYTIARNKLIDYFRSAGNKNVNNIVSLNAVEECIHLPKTEDLEQFQYQNEVQQKLMQSVWQLPRVQREVFMLKHDAGMTLEQIAELVGCGKETAKSRLRYALDKLKQYMADLDPNLQQDEVIHEQE